MTLQEIRQQAVNLTKAVDDFVISVEKDLAIKNADLDRRMKEYAMLGVREEELKKKEVLISKEQALLEREKQAVNEKQKMFEMKEKKLAERIQKVNQLMQV